MGVLHASTEKPHRFDLADVTLMATAADRLACAVDRTRLYDAEQRARAVAADALKARDDFLAMASHELKTPMTSLVLLVECLARSALKTSNGDLLPKLESIEHQVLRLAELTESLLDASR
jgi:signal transduction histidine kinase